jgi:hypothetical protein
MRLIMTVNRKENSVGIGYLVLDCTAMHQVFLYVSENPPGHVI